MKAGVVEAPNAGSYREVQAPAVGLHDVLVESRAAGLCRTDIEMMTGAFTDPRWVRFPVIPGHEWAGTVVEVGASVESVHVGDRVVCEGFVVCHRRRRCRSGETHWCDRVVETAGAPVAVTLATELCRPGGRAVLLGIAGEGRALTLPSDLLVGKDMSLIGSIAYPVSTWSRVVGLVCDRVLDLDPIVTHRFSMSDFEEAVRLMDDRRGIVAKIVLEHAAT